MKHSTKKIVGSKIELEVELSKEEFNDYWQPVYDQALSAVALKGFRPGAAPRELAEKVIDVEKVFQEATNKAVRHSLNEIIEKNNWTIIDQPDIEITGADQGLKFKGVITLFPEIDLKDYKSVAHQLNQETQKKITDLKVDDSEVEKNLEWLRKSRAATKTVARAAQTNDIVDLTINSLGKEQQDQFVLGEGRFLPGFEEQIINHKSSEELSFTLIAPEDYWNEKLRGQKIDFKVKINNILERELPELDENFAKSLGKFETVADLKKSLKEGLLEEKIEKEKERARLSIIEKIIDQAIVDLPEIMVNRTLDGLVEQSANSWKAAGKTEDQARRDLKIAAEKRVRTHLAIYQLARLEKLNPTPEEVEAEISKINQSQSQLDSQKLYDYIYGVIQNRKVFSYLENL